MNEPTSARKWRGLCRQRCPLCCEGAIYDARRNMLETCSVCGLKYEREPGYFVGSLYVSYAVACVFFGVGIVTGHLLLPHWDLSWFVPILVLLFLPLAPTVARYARVIWLYFDHWAWPAKLEKLDSDKQP